MEAKSVHEVAGAEVVVAEGTLLDPGTRSFEERGSLTAAEAGELARAAGAETLVLSHLWQEFGFDALRNSASVTFPGRLELARPGLAVEWSGRARGIPTSRVGVRSARRSR